MHPCAARWKRPAGTSDATPCRALCAVQGWRIEVDAYPQLTSVGAWRGGRDNVPTYGGYYTKADVRALLQHSLVRMLTRVQ